jgi:23S rRNA pseudouridine1911/1915/1917 synthase
VTVDGQIVPDALAGERVDRVVSFLTDCSRSEAAALIADGQVLLDGAAVKARSVRVEAGQVIVVPEVDHTPIATTPDPDVVLTIVHEDDDVLVVNKPAGLVVHPGAGHDTGTLVQGALAHVPTLATVGDPGRPGIVHRLDHGTSGLLVVAKTQPAYDSLVDQFGSRTVERRYVALAWGHPEDEVGLIDAPIGRSVRRPTRMTVSASGREARTRFEVQRLFEVPAATAVLTCRLETGRTHQIRVHLSAIGHPVVGDDQYGGVRPSITTDRPLLHAATLGFEHPGTGEHLAFEAPLPDDFTSVLDELS